MEDQRHRRQPRSPSTPDQDQEWFWSPAWQGKEAEADQALGPPGGLLTYA
ncbi:hypothetical protein [Kitasatospora sp. NPDC008115]